MKSFSLAPIAAILVFATCAQAQIVSDLALEECQTANTSYTSIKDCLPATDVAMIMLSATESADFYGESGRNLVEACRDLNDSSVSAWSCVSNAISDAVELLEMVGSPEKIKDERFSGVSDPQLFKKLKVLESEERDRFDQLMWGLHMYHPLK